MKNRLFLILSSVFIITAIYHLVAVFFPINDSPVWRNLLFVVINLVIALGIIKRPSYFIFLFVLLMIQQFYSHGSDLIDLWHVQHKIDWISLLVILYLPIVFVFLLKDRNGKLA